MTDIKKDPHAELMRLALVFGEACGTKYATGSSKAFDEIDNYARTLTDRIAELEAEKSGPYFLHYQSALSKISRLEAENEKVEAMNLQAARLQIKTSAERDELAAQLEAVGAGGVSALQLNLVTAPPEPSAEMYCSAQNIQIPTGDEDGLSIILNTSQIRAIWLAMLAAAPRPQQIAEPVDRSTWCKYVAGMVGAYLGEPVESERITAITGIIERRLQSLPAIQSKQIAEPASQWDEPKVKSLAIATADKVAKNAGSAPNLCFPHIYLALRDALLHSATPKEQS